MGASPSRPKEPEVMTPRQDIEEIVNRETGAWDTRDVALLLSVFHPDLVWPWPPHGPLPRLANLGHGDGTL